MEQHEYQTLFDIEDDYWWYVGLRELVFSTMNQYSHRENGFKVLDAGCGSGGVLKRLDRYSSYGFDFSDEAIFFCQKQGIKNISKASIHHIPYNDHCFDLVISLDVLCNLDDQTETQALQELFRVTKKGGHLILNLPAYEGLRSSHDKAVHIKHRYNKKELRQRIERAGFTVLKLSYRNFLLFPLMALIRLMKKNSVSSDSPKSDLKPLPTFLNQTLKRVLTFENKLLPHMNIPFGLSLFCVARK